jgi:uncharacterized membrane protein YdfJ with MMPL/SSD domain
MMTSIIRWILAHKRIVTVFWVVVTLVGIATVGSSTKSFSTTFSVQGRAGFVTNSQILRIYHGDGNSALVLAALVIATTSLQPGTPNAAALSKRGDAQAGLVALERSGIGAGALQPRGSR